MTWPTPADFCQALQNPAAAFRDARLRKCEIERNALRQPRPRSGQFATVYRALLPDQSWAAVRTFNTESRQRRERYEIISRYLQGRSLQSLVRFEYQDDGIRSFRDGKNYPLLVMDWAQGETLFEWLCRGCREGEGDVIACMAETWRAMIAELRMHGVTHGDLHHENVLVSTEGRLTLVDYDGMCVPELVGTRNVELGIAPYQHPGRNEQTALSPDTDNFSALLIYTVLRALAVAPDLWIKHINNTAYDRLLFRSSDLREPATSELCRDLMGSPDKSVARLVKRLCELAYVPMQETPSLEVALQSLDLVSAKPVTRGGDYQVRSAPPPPTVSDWKVATTEEAGEDEPIPQAPPLQVKIVHEWQTSGFLADLVLGNGDAAGCDELTVALRHQLLGKEPVQIKVRVPRLSEDPVQYVRLKEFIEQWPLQIRIYRPWRTKRHWLFEPGRDRPDALTVKTTQSGTGIASDEAVGYITADGFRPLIAPGTALPCVVTRRLVTKKAFQRSIAVIPAVKRGGQEIRLSKVGMNVLPADVGVAWASFSFHLDTDGRLTVLAQNPLAGMRIEDMVLSSYPA